MRAVRRLVAHQLAAGWRGWVALALLIGLAGGVVLTTAAGARRTSSAYARFLVAEKASDALVAPAGTGQGGYDRELASLPGVVAVAPVDGINAEPIGPGGKPVQASVVAPGDDRFGRLLETGRMLAGRRPDASRAGEALIDQTAARQLRLRLGSTLAMIAVPNSGRGGRRVIVRVVGIMVTRGSVVPVNELDTIPTIVASPALAARLGPAYRAFDGAYVQLRPGYPVSSLSRSAEALARRFPATGGQVFVADERGQAATIQRSIRPQALALALFAAVLALTALLVLGQLAVRLLQASAADNPALAGLGMTRGQLAAAAVTEVAITAAAGALLAVAVAVAASPLMPIGPARVAEPHPGVSADLPVLAAGWVITLLALVVRVSWPAWRLASARLAGVRMAGGRSRSADWLARSGAPVSLVTGVRLALDPGHGRTKVPVRSAMLGLALSAAAVSASITFGANLLHLVQTPSLYGKNWDAAVDLQFASMTAQRFEKLTAEVPGITGWTYGVHGTVTIRSTVIPAIGLAAGRGSVSWPTMLAGRPPASGQQIVLGTSVLRQLGLRAGQHVRVSAAGRTSNPQITGTAIFPYFGQGSFTATDLGTGAIAAVPSLDPQARAASHSPGYNFVLIRFAAGQDRNADIAALRRALAPVCARAQQSTCVITDQRPNGISDYTRIDGTPAILAGVLALLGLAVLGQITLMSARRRRHDFAVLRTLGMLRLQVSGITAWQAVTMAAVALLLGLPAGVAAGHWAWAGFAAAAGVPPAALTPALPLLLTIPAGLLASLVVSAWPGRFASLGSPAAALRAE